jgi:hypothetical protein
MLFGGPTTPAAAEKKKKKKATGTGVFAQTPPS